MHPRGQADQRPHRCRQVLAELIDLYGAPEYIRSDNGSEFIETKLRAWLAANKIKTIY